MGAFRWLLLAALAAAAALLAPAVASAHADLRGSEPRAGAALDAPPEVVRLALGAPVERAFLSVEVTGPDGRRVSGVARRDPLDVRAAEVPLTDAGPGRYTVSWRALAQDGHVSGGVLAFEAGPGGERGAVGEAPAPIRADDGPLPVLARLLVLAAPILLLGLVVLRFGVVEPARRAGGVAPPGEGPAVATVLSERAGAALAAAGGRWWAVWWGAVTAGALGVVLLPVALLSGLRQGPGGLGTLLGDTRIGTALAVQVGALLAAAAAAWAFHRHEDAWADAPPWAPAVGLGVPPAVALVAISWSGHASSGADRIANIAIDAAHGLATAAWIGGLAGLVALVPATLARLHDPERIRFAAGAVVRFSALAIAAVTTLVVTGLYRALAELTSLADLLDTAYGRALLVKLAIFGVLLLGGAYNRMLLHPRLERAALGLADTDRGAGRALRVSVAAELTLATALMVAVALMLSLPPPA